MEDVPQADVVAALLRRVRRARSEAEAAVARSRALSSARELLREHRLLRRCAWCGRIALGPRWAPATELPGFVSSEVQARATHSICPDCIAELEREGGTELLLP